MSAPNLDRIKKLLRLATSPFPHEAALAMSHAVAMAERANLDLSSLRDDAEVGAIIHGWIPVGTPRLTPREGASSKQIVNYTRTVLLQNYEKAEGTWLAQERTRKDELLALNTELETCLGDISKRRALERRVADVKANQFIAAAHYDLCLGKITTTEYGTKVGMAKKVSAPPERGTFGKKTAREINEIRTKMLPVAAPQRCRFWSLGWRYWTIRGNHVFAARCFHKALTHRSKRTLLLP